MKIAFVVARVGDERNVIQRLALALTKELKRQGQTVEVVKFTKKGMLNPFWGLKLRRFNVVFIANVGLQCAYFSLLKRLKVLSKPFLVFAFGSDIREITHRLINFWNWCSKPAVDVLVPVNPDLVAVAEKRGYRRVEYVHNWAEALT